MCIRSGSFAKLLRCRPFHNFLPGSLQATILVIGMSNRDACGWSQGPMVKCGCAHV